MRLICQNCGNDHSAYFSLNSYNWYVDVQETMDGPSLRAEPSDCEQTRYHRNKIGAIDRMTEALEAGQILKTRKTFDCLDCGEDDCVRMIET